MNKNNEILKKAIEFWGVEMQTMKIAEEAAELSLAIIRMGNPTKDKKAMEDNLYEELGDMKIMMAIVDMIYDKERINERVRYKLIKMNKKYFSS